MKKQTVITLNEQDVLRLYCAQMGIPSTGAYVHIQTTPGDRNESPKTEIIITINEDEG